jgi:RimJ/RimL family protein N-acetyltransferase
LPVLTGARVVLRDWTDDDLAPFAELNADPAVMAHFPGRLTRAESDSLASRIRDRLRDDGYGLWALEVPGVTQFAGYVGLSMPTFSAAFTPCHEVGWRLARAHWGHGYATEAARMALQFAFGALGLAALVSFTARTNIRSQRVMQRLGMTHDPAEDFDHPKLPAGHALRPHVLYRLKRSQVAGPT